jgi:hypothetical protein
MFAALVEWQESRPSNAQPWTMRDVLAASTDADPAAEQLTECLSAYLSGGKMLRCWLKENRGSVSEGYRLTVTGTLAGVNLWAMSREA